MLTLAGLSTDLAWRGPKLQFTGRNLDKFKLTANGVTILTAHNHMSKRVIP